jgi:hypothetical protein
MDLSCISDPDFMSQLQKIDEPPHITAYYRGLQRRPPVKSFVLTVAMDHEGFS